MKNTKSSLANIMNLEFTDSLDTLCYITCENDNEVLAVHSILWQALQKYQWKYQKASVGTPTEEIKSIKNNFNKVITLVKNQGHKSVASELEDICNDIVENKISTKSTILSAVGRMMKAQMTNSWLGLKGWEYDRRFSKLMKTAFKEHCKKFKLESSQLHIDINFKVPKRLITTSKKR